MRPDKGLTKGLPYFLACSRVYVFECKFNRASMNFVIRFLGNRDTVASLINERFLVKFKGMFILDSHTALVFVLPTTMRVVYSLFSRVAFFEMRKDLRRFACN